MLLIRHAECLPDYAADPPLTSLGAANFTEKARHLPHVYRVDKIFFSPKRRSVQTAHLLLAFFPTATFLCEDCLREISSPHTTTREETDRVRRAMHITESSLKSCSSAAFVSHQHLLTAILCNLTKASCTDLQMPFTDFGAIIHVSPPLPSNFQPTNHEAFHKWQPVLFR